MTIDIEERGLARLFVDEVVVPDFFIECFGWHRWSFKF